MEYSDKIAIVLIAMKEATGLVLKGKPIHLHPKDPMLNNVSSLNLSNILKKLQDEIKIITIISEPNNIAWGFSDIERQSEESYHIITLTGFDAYCVEYLRKCTVNSHVIKQAGTPVITNTNDIVFCITFSDKTREIILNDIFLLARPNLNGTNELIFSYLYRNANKLVSHKTLEAEATKEPITKRLDHVVRELGFNKDLAKIFFSISKKGIIFYNPISIQDLLAANIAYIRLFEK